MSKNEDHVKCQFKLLLLQQKQSLSYFCLCFEDKTLLTRAGEQKTTPSIVSGLKYYN